MDYQARQNNVIAQGALTNSKHPSAFVEGVYPTHLVQGAGAFVWDTEGNRYLDFIGSLGANILGYRHEVVDEAIKEQLCHGITFSLSTPLEFRVGEQLQALFPFVERLKFLKTGNEATLAALKIARAYTGKSLVLSEGYHGHGDEWVSLTPPARGVPPVHIFTQLLAPTLIEEQIASAGAVILEPVQLDHSEERRLWLKRLREICTRTGTLLIFDEIVTGFRWKDFCVANYWGIYPDLICLGKAMANGMPISVVGGSAEIMGNDYFVSSTFAGETLSLAAAQATIDILSKGPYLESTEGLWHYGNRWMAAFNDLAADLDLKLIGYPTRGRFVGDPLTIALFFQESIAHGLLFGMTWFYTTALIDRFDYSITQLEKVLCKLKQGVSLKGKLPRSPTAEKSRK